MLASSWVEAQGALNAQSNAIATHLIKKAGLTRIPAQTGAVTPIQG